MSDDWPLMRACSPPVGHALALDQHARAGTSWPSASGAAARCPSCRIRPGGGPALAGRQGQTRHGVFPGPHGDPQGAVWFGWDFAPRLLSTGIWDDMRLVVARGAYIEDMWVQAEPLTEEQGSGIGEEETDAGAVSLCACRSGVGRPVRFGLKSPLRPRASPRPQSTRPSTLDLDLNLELSLDLPSARRWWPWDQGEPCLYRVTVRLLDEAGVLDEASQVVGVRVGGAVRRCRTAASGGGWSTVGLFSCAALTGCRPMFCPDGSPRPIMPAYWGRRGPRVSIFSEYGAAACEKQAFWDICDRLGIMAWQEFPLACAFLDRYPRDRGIPRLAHRGGAWDRAGLRNHPSLIAWCGGNEISPGASACRYGTRTGAAEEDPARPWIPASPCEGDIHQWDVWHGSAPWTDLAGRRRRS